MHLNTGHAGGKTGPDPPGQQLPNPIVVSNIDCRLAGRGRAVRARIDGDRPDWQVGQIGRDVGPCPTSIS